MHSGGYCLENKVLKQNFFKGWNQFTCRHPCPQPYALVPSLPENKTSSCTDSHWLWRKFLLTCLLLRTRLRILCWLVSTGLGYFLSQISRSHCRARLSLNSLSSAHKHAFSSLFLWLGCPFYFLYRVNSHKILKTQIKTCPKPNAPSHPEFIFPAAESPSLTLIGLHDRVKAKLFKTHRTKGQSMYVCFEKNKDKRNFHMFLSYILVKNNCSSIIFTNIVFPWK